MISLIKTSSSPKKHFFKELLILEAKSITWGKQKTDIFVFCILVFCIFLSKLSIALDIFCKAILLFKTLLFRHQYWYGLNAEILFCFQHSHQFLDWSESLLLNCLVPRKVGTGFNSGFKVLFLEWNEKKDYVKPH